ncbi:mCG148215 [Mus musculus]|nr:mCG148215 [Mus musculus]
MESCDTVSAPGHRWKQEGSCPWSFLGSCVLMALGGSLLGQEFEQKWWSHLCSQVCQHSWETLKLKSHNLLL